MKLVSMVDYVELQNNTMQSSFEYKESIKKYANFLKQPLELWMFIPCDSNGKYLEEPKGIKCCAGIINDCGCQGDLHYNQEELDIFLQAKNKCLFEFNSAFLGFTQSDMDNSNIEELLTDDFDYYLIPTALKQIGV